MRESVGSTKPKGAMKVKEGLAQADPCLGVRLMIEVGSRA